MESQFVNGSVHGKAEVCMVPKRETPDWVKDIPVRINTGEDIYNAALGRLPLGILPSGVLIRSEEERHFLTGNLLEIPDKKYGSTDSGQAVRYWGRPFVDSITLADHFSQKDDEAVTRLSAPLVQRLEEYLVSRGFNVTRMIDPFSGQPYTAGVFRAINVVNNESVLHVDDFIRDGMLKPDFQVPYLLRGKQFFQVSFNTLLSDGGYEPDSLYAYNQFFCHEHEALLKDNGWQFYPEAVKDRKSLRYTPQPGESYMFSTSCFHDVRGGSPLSKRLTFSCFGIYVPELNLFMLYN